MACVIAIAGPPASGKSTLAQALGYNRSNWRVVSFGQYVRELAQEQRLSSDRATLQELGQRLVAQGPKRFCEAVLSWAGWRPGAPLILDGVRHVAILDALRSLTAPMPYYVVYVEVNEVVQKERLMKRGSASFGVLDLDRHPTESEVRYAVRERADIVVCGDKPVGLATSAILELLPKDGGNVP